MSICIFSMCLQDLHEACVQFGPLPNTIGGNRLVCACSCHDESTAWSASDADRMATFIASEHGTDPRVDQIVDGRFVRVGGGAK